MEIQVSAGVARATVMGVDRGMDVPFRLLLDGAAIEGEVTLRPATDGRPIYEAWGEPDHWVDGRTLARLRDLDARAYRAVLQAIEEATSAAAGEP